MSTTLYFKARAIALISGAASVALAPIPFSTTGAPALGEFSGMALVGPCAFETTCGLSVALRHCADAETAESIKISIAVIDRWMDMPVMFTFLPLTY
jgi:hypothetical protein